MLHCTARKLLPLARRSLFYCGTLTRCKSSLIANTQTPLAQNRHYVRGRSHIQCIANATRTGFFGTFWIITQKFQKLSVCKFDRIRETLHRYDTKKDLALALIDFKWQYYKYGLGSSWTPVARLSVKSLARSLARSQLFVSSYTTLKKHL